MAIRWSNTMAMALYDFKATKKPSSWLTYEVALRDFFSFLQQIGVMSPDQVTTTHITSYIAFLKNEKKADRTIRLYAAAASSFFDYLLRPRDTQGTAIIKSNPFNSIKDALPKIQAYERSNNLKELSLEDYQKILATCDSKTLLGLRDRAILSLIFWTIRRRKEISRLKKGDFGWEKAVPYVRFLTKGGKYMSIDLTSGIMQALETYWTASHRKMVANSPAFVATTDAGKYLLEARNIQKKDGETPLSPSALDRLLKSRAKQAGIDPEATHVHVHGLRHLGARVLREQEMDVKLIKERLGHSRLDTTDIYLGSMERISADGLEGFEKLALGGG